MDVWKYSPMLYCGVRLTQDVRDLSIQADLGECVDRIMKPSIISPGVPVKKAKGIAPLGLACSAGLPELCFDVSPLGSKLLHQKCRTSRRRKGCSGMQMHTRRLV